MEEQHIPNFHPSLREIKVKKGEEIFRKDGMKKRVFEFMNPEQSDFELQRINKPKLDDDLNIDEDDPLTSRIEEHLWKIYFLDETSELHEAKDVIKLFKQRYQEKQFKFDLKEIEEGNRITFDYLNLMDLSATNKIKRKVIASNNRVEQREITIQIENLISKKSIMVLKALSLVAHLIYLLKTKDCEEIQSLCDAERIFPLTFRLLNHFPLTPISNFTSSMIEKIITVHGTVVRTSSIKALATQVEFVCISCHRAQTVLFEDGKYCTPSKCTTRGCKGKVLYPERGLDSATRTKDLQALRLQELKSDCDDEDLGRVPRILECELTEELVDQAIPGDVVKCTGILKLRKTEENGGRFKAFSTMHTFYLDVIYITKALSQDANDEADPSDISDSKSKDLTIFSDRDLQFIVEIFNEPQLFKLIVNSFCPEIFGHELVKFGILLSLFGGRKRNTEVGSSFNIRGDPHVLIVGDPGLGKSQMLSAAVKLAPRGVYICGSSGVSSSGLTVSLVKESGSGDFALEAGALVLSDQGCCCIDEFDKMSSDHDALLEAMEQQSISIAKAGIVCSLPARTSIIAAANPVGGHYNKGKTVSENLKMSGPLLSRFDLVFILLDKPDEQMDKFLSHHVMQLHSGRKEQSSNTFSQSYTHPLTQDMSLQARIKKAEGENLDLLNLSLFRKYIAYARQYVHPKLSSQASQKLKEFYLELRASYHTRDATPITTRQLESLIRLAEARAKMELREVVLESDAMDVIELLRFSLFDSYMDNDGSFEIQRSQNGSGMSKKSQIKQYITRLTKLANDNYVDLFTYNQLYQISQEMNLNIKMEFKELIENLNHHGYLLKKGNNTFQLTTSDL